MRPSWADTPPGRLGTPGDVTEAVLFPWDRTRAGYITGQTLSVDGGFTRSG
ncbi:SDR family oxidoreductase [Streptomyces sp. NPDC088812]|uniref:SDR family oxidoreductase n=1 Tax=Streptomyces sp. NPDC088812 TaxID=3365905 RepID=UPI0037FB4FF4